MTPVPFCQEHQSWLCGTGGGACHPDRPPARRVTTTLDLAVLAAPVPGPYGPTWTVPLAGYHKPPLSSNGSHGNVYARARVKAEVRANAHAAAIRAGLPRGLDRVHIELHYVPKVRRPRDTDNTATLKPCIDGLVADHGLCAGDDQAHVTSAYVIDPVNRANLATRLYLRIVQVQ